MVHLPRQRTGKRVKGFVQARDLTATILELFGLPGPENCLGRSLLPLTRGMRRGWRDHATYGHQSFMAHVCFRKWLYAAWRGYRPCMLFDRQKDPNLTTNVAGKFPQVVARLHKTLLDDLRKAGADEDSLASFK